VSAKPDAAPLIDSRGAILELNGDSTGYRVRQFSADGTVTVFDLQGGDGLRAFLDLLAERRQSAVAGDAEPPARPATAE
jgi:hypothetical protein